MEIRASTYEFWEDTNIQFMTGYLIVSLVMSSHFNIRLAVP